MNTLTVNEALRIGLERAVPFPDQRPVPAGEVKAWFSPYPLVDYLIGVDLAQGGADWTAIVILERQEPVVLPHLREEVVAALRYLSRDNEVYQEARRLSLVTYDVIWIERWRSRETALVPATTLKMVQGLEQRHVRRQGDLYGRVRQPLEYRVAVDVTGVGPFGSDPLVEEGLEPYSITIHGGDATSNPDPYRYRVPKRDLAGAVHALLEEGRLRVGSRVPHAAVLRAELENFRVKITRTGHDRYEAGTDGEWREGENDDLVLAAACAAWLGEKLRIPRLDPGIAGAWQDGAG